MVRPGTYYMGRVLKLGVLKEPELIKAIQHAATISSRNHSWTITDTTYIDDPDGHFVFGKLVKFSPEAEVIVVDTTAHAERTMPEPNLRRASSPFVFIPAHSGIAFLRVHNDIEHTTFVRNFCRIIEESLESFFVKCEIDIISDLTTFAAKIKGLDQIIQISVTVSPPNPLFGPLWESLKDYLNKRKADKLKIVEDAPSFQGLNTELADLVCEVASVDILEESKKSKDVLIGDAAVLMAADGYGTARIKGRKRKETVIVTTSDNAFKFPFAKDPDPFDFYKEADKIFEHIRKSRHMEH